MKILVQFQEHHKRQEKIIMAHLLTVITLRKQIFQSTLRIKKKEKKKQKQINHTLALLPRKFPKRTLPRIMTKQKITRDINQKYQIHRRLERQTLLLLPTPMQAQNRNNLKLYQNGIQSISLETNLSLIALRQVILLQYMAITIKSIIPNQDNNLNLSLLLGNPILWLLFL